MKKALIMVKLVPESSKESNSRIEKKILENSQIPLDTDIEKVEVVETDSIPSMKKGILKELQDEYDKEKQAFEFNLVRLRHLEIRAREHPEAWKNVTKDYHERIIKQALKMKEILEQIHRLNI
ncbi:MAG: hypothetical protein PVG48_00720 [Candidatus Bathyarchaeota archaeon]|jgi:hypothetical protein